MRNKFDIVLQAPPETMQQGDAIHTRYFTIDTADLTTFYEWYEFNPLIVTYALHKGEVIGYFNIIPITTECAALFDQQAIQEEDLTIDHILPPDVLQHAQFAYLASIAIKDSHNFLSRQCAAVLVSTIAAQFLKLYNLSNLKRIYANPTTFDGNHLVRKLGLQPVVSLKKPLRGNDIYALDVVDMTLPRLQYLSKRYDQFIATSPWK